MQSEKLNQVNDLENEKIEIICDNKILKKDEKVFCKIIIKNLKYSVTSVSCKLMISENLKIINSEYDNDDWKIFDKEFTISDINLISEEKKYRESFTIANFTITATKNIKNIENISIENLSLGDSNYEEHIIQGVIYPIEIQKKANTITCIISMGLLIITFLFLIKRVIK